MASFYLHVIYIIVSLIECLSPVDAKTNQVASSLRELTRPRTTMIKQEAASKDFSFFIWTMKLIHDTFNGAWHLNRGSMIFNIDRVETVKVTIPVKRG